VFVPRFCFYMGFANAIVKYLKTQSAGRNLPEH
jgi:hypothetical protein